MRKEKKCILILGCGYVGEKLAAACMAEGMHVIATTRHKTRASALENMGIEAVCMTSPADLSDTILASVDAIVDSIPLSRDQAEMYASQRDWLPKIAQKLSHIHWAAYLSTTGVYGDAAGAWVDENHICQPSSARGKERLKAEQCWLRSGLPAEVFRLAGIYGPERNIIAKLNAGGYQAVRWQPAHYSSRIHIDDIVAALMASMQKPRSGRIVNVADDLPLPHVDYVTELAAAVGAEAPQVLTPQEGQQQLSPAMLSFFRDNKRISNRRLHAELLPILKYPSFRDAVDSLL